MVYISCRTVAIGKFRLTDRKATVPSIQKNVNCAQKVARGFILNKLIYEYTYIM